MILLKHTLFLWPVIFLLFSISAKPLSNGNFVFQSDSSHSFDFDSEICSLNYFILMVDSQFSFTETSIHLALYASDSFVRSWFYDCSSYWEFDFNKVNYPDILNINNKIGHYSPIQMNSDPVKPIQNF